ncbi:hypothetical protein GTO89_00035 [Heliobacterium gestii]|uniref:Stage II sporulation protein M n=1 Tax=Heliomicrobium gestii TaxID=2699 RepID=A0A845L9R1_HELGE|nr:stage II sporulation protein M [Heliomicrobium gestii]MBM7865150.1 stage II sporulation protein M [Heliomicrobium gestii]MZP41419.1 hypothetical protein [Heliomicrobium gestii]
MAILFHGGAGGMGQGNLNTHWGLYALALATIACGTAAGALSAKYLPPGQASELQVKLLETLQGIKGGAVTQALLEPAVMRNVETLGLIVLLGLTALGIPLIAGLLFFRGFVLGFAAGFLLLSRASDGWVIVLLALAPASLLFLPALVLSGGMALALALHLARGRRPYQATSLGRTLLQYAGAGVGTLLLGAGAGLIDAYVTPGLLRLFIR